MGAVKDGDTHLATEMERLERRHSRLRQEGDEALKNVVAAALSERASKEGVNLADWQFDAQKDFTISENKPRTVTLKFTRSSVIEGDELETAMEKMRAEGIEQMTKLGLHPTADELAAAATEQVRLTQKQLKDARTYSEGQNILETGQLLNSIHEHRFSNHVRFTTSPDGGEHILTQYVSVTIPEAALKKNLGITHQVSAAKSKEPFAAR